MNRRIRSICVAALTLISPLVGLAQIRQPTTAPRQVSIDYSFKLEYDRNVAIGNLTVGE